MLVLKCIVPDFDVKLLKHLVKRIFNVTSLVYMVAKMQV